MSEVDLRSEQPILQYQHRVDAKLSLEDAAKELGLTRKQLCDIEWKRESLEPWMADEMARVYKKLVPSSRRHLHLADHVAQMISERDDLSDLCGEILATLNLPSNRVFIERLPPEMARLITVWTNRHKRITGE